MTIVHLVRTSPLFRMTSLRLIAGRPLRASSLRPLAFLVESGVAWHSTESFSAATAEQSSCPMGAASTRPTATDEAVPKLVKVPSLPLLGSLIQSYSGTPPMDSDKTFDAWPEMRRRFGDFYSFGLPGMGVGSHGTVYMLQDPHEFMRVLRSEGKYPTSVVQLQWAFLNYFEDEGNETNASLLGHGAEWKRIRTFLQSDLLSPQSAARYIPGIVKAVEHASKGVESRGKDLNNFLNEASFDMFSMILLGDMPRITDPSTESQPDDVTFYKSVANAFRKNNLLRQDIYQLIMGKTLGIKTQMYKEFEGDWKTATAIAQKKTSALLEKRNNGQLSEDEEACYFNQAIERQEASDGTISIEDVQRISNFLLTASVDTTSAKMSWFLLHVAQNPPVQERLFEELTKQVAKTDGKLTAEALTSTAAPYLNACIRESHRLTSAATISIWRKIPNELEVHGVTLPAGSMVAFDGYSRGVDPDVVVNPHEFLPERWLPDAVEARKGNPAQSALDHPLYSGPFGQGARRCPGSRVARNEALLLLAQLVLDWKMTCAVESWRDVKYHVDTAITCHLPEIEFTAR